ncbi:MAG: hypothetical protein JWM44_3038 [Bacilli bacterium]|nr:hypothetical protein [Bacilli bacterium]
MKIWLLVTTEKCLKINLASFKDYKEYITSYYEGTKKEWEPVKVITIRKGNKSDCAEFTLGYPVFMRKAKDILAPLINKQAEFLPVDHDEHELYLVNVRSVLDIVDMSNPVERKIKYGYFSEFVHIHPEKIDTDVHIFKIPQHLGSRIYVSDTFKNVVETNKLKGFHFVEVWDTDNSEGLRRERLKKYDIYFEGSSSRNRLPYSDAWKLVSEKKIMVRNQKNIIHNKEGTILFGEIFEDESIQWIDPIYIPPLFLELEWIVYEVVEIELLVKEYFAELSFEVNGARGTPVTFEDKVLEGIVRRHLQIYKDPLTTINLLKVRHLAPNNRESPVTSLKGIEHAIYIKELGIFDNPNFDVNELKYIPPSLSHLALRNCGLSSLRILDELDLPQLYSVFLADNRIMDLAELIKFSNLSKIDIYDNAIEDIRPLNQLPLLEVINLRNNPVQNISELQLPKLRYLYMSGIQSEDWSGLISNFPALEYLSVSDEGMTDASKKVVKEIIKKKHITVAWTKSENGLAKIYNHK